MRRKLGWLVACVCLALCAWGVWRAPSTKPVGRPAAAQQAAPRLTKTVSQFGITWTFASEARVGQFVNGDYYVVGPVTVTEIAPEPLLGEEARDETERGEREDGLYARNGSVLNLPTNGEAGYDSRIINEYDPALFARLPVTMQPGDSLISTISMQPGERIKRSIRGWVTGGRGSPVRTTAVLTCLAEPAPADAFRPSYCDREQKLYVASDLRRDLLPRLPREGIPFRVEDGFSFTIDEWADRFQRPWVDTVFFCFAAPVENMPLYGRELGRAVGIAGLLLCLDFTPEEKERLLVNFVQTGIDYWGVIRAGHRGWPAHGGHGSGRKWPIVFAGIMLGDEQMASPTTTYPEVKFGEDMQTMYGEGWTGAKALYAGHVGEAGNPRYVGWGAYEHLHPSEWESRIGEAYRR
ncbi:MAG: hypothetical protein PVH68_21640, partial [Armatimonadota bacterium]